MVEDSVFTVPFGCSICILVFSHHVSSTRNRFVYLVKQCHTSFRIYYVLILIAFVLFLVLSIKICHLFEEGSSLCWHDFCCTNSTDEKKNKVGLSIAIGFPCAKVCNSWQLCSLLPLVFLIHFRVGHYMRYLGMHHSITGPLMNNLWKHIQFSPKCW